MALWGIVIALSLGGAWLIAYPFISNFWAGHLQNGLEQDFAALEAGADPGANGYSAANRPAEGKALTRLKIPKLGVNVIVVEGTSGNALRAGAGHFYETALPGENGNVAIAGHRTGYGEPFRHIDKLTKGDQIILETPYSTFVYKVMPAFDGHPNPWVVPPTDITVKGATSSAVVTLVSCDPPGTNENRLIVRAALFKQIDK
jgi:sortase A